MNHIQQAVALLRRGDLVALPTETVYGLGADAMNPKACAKIFAAKGRPSDHPLIVHLPDAEQLPVWARAIPKEAIALARAFWPGPLTLILKKHEDVPDLVTGGQDTVGLRVPNHPVALELLRAFGGGIAAPSANRFGRISPTTAAHVREELGDRVPLILDGGPCQVGLESTILDLSRDVPVILRPGAIGVDDIARVIGRRPRLRGEDEGGQGGDATPRVSGALAAHYAPRTPLELIAGADLLAAIQPGDAVLARMARPDSLPDGLRWVVAAPDAATYGHDLYAALRDLDAAGCRRILVETPPASPEWSAVIDRLGRAAVGSGEDDET
ncbi:L-threonylcarbamoyladenylate synthase [Zoogloea sp. 1C4]|uniref:L-threonylcarbamoyladenylate synthase n=1 Tax=Zoogloea sp. 1C4 TaxID=2570190 RepID=UPI001290BA1E|nr:L-threonylcarbamoyladenylate synthase [Zoogloea sp. 1C4]